MQGTHEYATEAGSHLEHAYELYHQTLALHQIPASGDGSRFHAHIMTDLFIPEGKLEHPVGSGPSDTYIEVRGNLSTGVAKRLAQNLFHEYFHAVTNCYLPYAGTFGLDSNAKAELWCIEGTSRFMQYWGVSQFAAGGKAGDIHLDIDINLSLTDFDPGWFWGAVYHSEEGWLSDKTHRSLRNYNNGYSAFLYWYFLALAPRGSPGEDGALHTDIGVVRRFWEAMAQFSQWSSDHGQQTRQAMDAALAGAPSAFAGFDAAFTEFSRSLAFPDQYFGPCRVTSLLKGMAPIFIHDVPVQEGTTTVSGDDASVEEMGARYFKLTNAPREGSITLTFESGKNAGYIASIYPAGKFTSNPIISGDGSVSCELSADEANETLIVLSRLPGSSGTAPALLKIETQRKPSSQGFLDLVFCIDTTGSMTDDIQAVKDASSGLLDELSAYATEKNISLQVGLVTYQDHTDAQRYAGKPQAAWLRTWPLTADATTIRNNILAIDISDPSVGGDPEEDAYAAYMCAMDARTDWQGSQVHMGWRPGAAKILIPMCDAPAHDPDFEGRTLDVVSARAAQLDPVHIYPLLLPKQGSSFADPAVTAMQRAANATGGVLTRVNSAKELPAAMVATIKLAVRRHKEEVWRKSHPPYGLHAAVAAVGGLLLIALVSAVLSRRRRAATVRPAAATSRPTPDPLLTGDPTIHGPPAGHS